MYEPHNGNNDPRLIATAEFPVRASSLPTLKRCAWTWVMHQLGLQEDGSTEAADTGSAIHAAIHAFHTSAGLDWRKAIQSMKANLNDYPFASLEDAGEHFFHYASDPRNILAKILAIPEQEIRIEIPAHSTDRTGKAIVITGHLDQIREIDGMVTVVDAKSGKAEGEEMLNDYLFQLVAYQIGAAKLLNREVHRACILRTRDYLKKIPGIVFYTAPWTWKDTARIMDSITLEIARVRNGEISFAPGRHCNWCPERSVANCVPNLVKLESGKWQSK